MIEIEERHADYIELRDIKIELATMNANLLNIINMFNVHLTDDKKTVERVNNIDTALGRVYGGIALLGVLILCCLKGLKW